MLCCSWYGHVMRKSDGNKCKWVKKQRPKKRWIDSLKYDMAEKKGA